MSEKKLIVVAGPTAVGKTSVSIQLARHLGASVVSADSRQIFRQMTIGTAKPTVRERAEVPHYFIDTHSVGEDYDAARYAADALRTIERLFVTDNYVILTGGSGLYIKGVCEGFDDMPEVPEALRLALTKGYEEQGIGWLQQQMRQHDPEAFQQIDQKNPHRLIRALEVKMHSGESIMSFRQNKKREHPFRTVKIGLELPREELYRRIDQRMDQMLEQGLVEEATALYPMRHLNALQTVGYQEIFGYIDNEYDLDECVRLLKRNSRRYAKRQLTWFRKDKDFRWFSPDDVKAIIEFVAGE